MTLVLALTACASAAPPPPQSDLELLAQVGLLLADAPDRYRCLGFAYPEARSRAAEALGQDFPARLRALTTALEQRHGHEAVAEAMTIIPVGYRVTAKRCRTVRYHVRDARAALQQLERRVGIH
ncbi:MAG: hypothetical protein ACK40O_08775 [Allosphingosinicella sp.]